MLLYILAAGHLVRAAQFPLFLVLAGRGEHRVFGGMTLAMGFVAVVLGLFFCRMLGWGSIGVALGSTVAMVAVCGVALPYHCAKRLEIALADFARRSWFPAVYGVSPGILVLVLWKLWKPPATLFELALVAISTALVCGLSVWFLALDKTERSRFAGMAFASLEKFAPVSFFERITRLRRL